jgi:hypothetical protein
MLSKRFSNQGRLVNRLTKLFQSEPSAFGFFVFQFIIIKLQIKLHS